VVEIGPIDPQEALEVVAENTEQKVPDLTPVKSVEIELPNGQKVVLAPPEIATAFVVSRILGNETSPISHTYLKALMYVKEVAGEKINRPVNLAAAQILANKLGEAGMDSVVIAVSEFWPQPDQSSLKVIKKSY
jgi:hypothetical protein